MLEETREITISFTDEEFKENMQTALEKEDPDAYLCMVYYAKIDKELRKG